MTPRTKLAAFAVVLAAAFGGGAAVGSAVGPIDVGDGAPHPSHDTTSTTTAPHLGTHGT